MDDCRNVFVCTLQTMNQELVLETNNGTILIHFPSDRDPNILGRIL